MKKKIFGIFICILLIIVSVIPVAGIIDENDEINMKNDDHNKLNRPAIENGVISTDDWHEQAKLLASDGEDIDRFGHSVSIDSDYALIGAFADDDNGDKSGSAYVFKRNGSTWNQHDKLLPSDGEAGDYFGVSISMDADYAIIGARKDDDNGDGSGSAYVFKFNGSSWVEEQKLLASDGAVLDGFGGSVSIDGDYALVGARADDGGKGSAYIFKRNGTTWTEEAKLLASDGAVDDLFGHSVSIDGDYAIVGVRYDDDNGDGSGSVYVFKFNGSSWVEEQKLLASDGVVGDSFGVSVSIDGDYVLIGAFDPYAGADSGAAYIFKRNGTDWIEEVKLLPSGGSSDDGFGFSVSIEDDYVIVGAIDDDDIGHDSGSAYVFKYNGITWVENSKLLASDGAAYDEFGVSVSISADYAIIGARSDNDNGSECGSAYVFTKINENPPNQPSNPDPYSGEIGVDVNADLSWTGSDPDPWDTVTYDIYFGTTSSPPLVETNHSNTFYEPGTMSYNQIYYWQIVAWDNHGANNASDEWHFTTLQEVPDLDCSGILSWTDVMPGDIVTDSFTVENNGDPLSLLDWEIDSYPIWGTWSFDPDIGTGLEEGDTVTIYVEVIAPNVEEETFTGDVVMINSNDPSDTCTIPVSLTTPVTQPVQYPLLELFRERFPLLYQILNVVLRELNI